MWRETDEWNVILFSHRLLPVQIFLTIHNFNCMVCPSNKHFRVAFKSSDEAHGLSKTVIPSIVDFVIMYIEQIIQLYKHTVICCMIQQLQTEHMFLSGFNNIGS
jgi:hypothetical protein